MKELVETIAKALVDNADHVQVRAIEGEQVIVFELRVHPSDLGKVIRRQGARPSPSAPSRVRRASVINNSKPFFPPSKEAAAMNMLGFDEAIKEIAETCREAKQQKRTSPFVLLG